MTSVWCSSTLNRALAQGVTSGTAAGGSDNVRLGDWAAQLAGREFVVALEEQTCLTLVVRLRPVAGLRGRLAAALGLALADAGGTPSSYVSAPLPRRRSMVWVCVN